MAGAWDDDFGDDDLEEPAAPSKPALPQGYRPARNLFDGLPPDLLAACGETPVATAAKYDPPALAAATAALIRLDERIAGAPDHLAQGWMARTLIREAAANARLDGEAVDPDEVLLADRDTIGRAGDPGLHTATQALDMLRSAARRSPRQMFTPRRLAAIASLRLVTPRARQQGALPDWVRDRVATPEQVMESLADALDPAALGRLSRHPPLVGAALFLARWSATRAVDRVGKAPGRVLAAAWLRRNGFLLGATATVAIGFVGRRNDYVPDDSPAWINAFLEAVERAARSGLMLFDGLSDAERAAHRSHRPKRKSSRMPDAIRLLAAEPGLDAEDLASKLKMTGQASRDMLERLERTGHVREITGRSSFRLFAMTDGVSRGF